MTATIQIPELTDKEKERFIGKSNRKSEADGCWEWSGLRDKDGYGKFSIGRRSFRAHRIAVAMQGVEIPRNMLVCHSCDNPSCVRFSHLFIGTHKDNISDKESKGRGNKARGESHGSKTHPEKWCRGDGHYMRKNPERIPRGEARGSAKLNGEKVLELRRLRASGATLTRLAAMFGVSFGTISAICRRKKWTHI